MFVLPTLQPMVTFEVAAAFVGAAKDFVARSMSSPPGGHIQRQAVQSSAHASFAESEWSVAVSVAAEDLRSLKAGWNGPASPLISRRALFQAEKMVREALEGRRVATPPYLVPRNDGGVQVEWHEVFGELEFSITAGGDFYTWVRVHNSGEEFEGENEDALALFSRWAPRLASTTRHVSDVLGPQTAYFAIAA